MPSSTPPPSPLTPALLAQVQQLANQARAEIGRVYIGNPHLIDALLTALLARGHILLEGVPGVAKTTLVKAFAQVLGCRYRRIQFTPDLLPSDITGTYLLDPVRKDFVLREGPLFSQVVLGDEINRAPPKTQSALLEAMQEGQVTLEGETRVLPRPFLVLATQNPVEHEGTYPLPEAQLDRFLFKLHVGYPTAAAEKALLISHARPPGPCQPVFTPEQILTLQVHTESVHIDDELYDYVLELVRFTRQHRRIALGASPRAALALLHAARARALLSGRDYVLPDDLKLLAPQILSHRLMLIPEAEMEGISASTVVTEALSLLPVRGSEARRPA